MRVCLAAFTSAASIVPLYLILLALSGGLEARLLGPMLLAALAVAVLAVCCVALPLHFFLAWIERQNPLCYIAVGFIGPMLVTLVLNPFGTDIASWVKWQALAMGVLGACLAAIFWWIATGGKKKGLNDGQCNRA